MQFYARLIIGAGARITLKLLHERVNISAYILSLLYFFGDGLWLEAIGAIKRSKGLAGGHMMMLIVVAVRTPSEEALYHVVRLAPVHGDITYQ